MVKALLAARRRDTGGPPYPIPTTAPFNAPHFMWTPTPDGSGETVHPAVVDFGAGRKWHGWRYWMVITPFPGGESSLENPCILVSNNGWDWTVPSGMVNPIYPKPPGTRFNSDVDLEYDPRSDELVLIYREMEANGAHQTYYARSPDGLTWPHRPTALNWVRPGEENEVAGQVLSPSIIRKSDNEWVIFGILKDKWPMLRWTATSPEGTWAGPFTCANVPNGWHFDVIWDGAKFVMLLDHSAGAGDGFSAGVSADGHTWTFAPQRIMLPRVGEWDAGLYRPTLTRHEDGNRYRVWYSAIGTEGWRTGYTELPMTLWPAP